jgi:hypothetical protein
MSRCSSVSLLTRSWLDSSINGRHTVQTCLLNRHESLFSPCCGSRSANVTPRTTSAEVKRTCSYNSTTPCSRMGRRVINHEENYRFKNSGFWDARPYGLVSSCKDSGVEEDSSCAARPCNIYALSCFETSTITHQRRAS